MRRNNRRRPFNEERETRKIFIISLSVLIIAILAFVITFKVYQNYLNSSEDIAQYKMTQITDLGKVNQETSSVEEASTSIGKSVNEMQEINEVESNTNTTKIAINTSNMVKESTNTENSINNESEETKTSTSQEKTETKAEEKVADPTFQNPVEGVTTTQFAKDTLIYSSTLQEWVTHNGIDIKADKTTIVKASAEGSVKSIKNDPRYGITVVIEHVNGYSSVYSNLLTAEFVKEGEEVKQGQTIGTVGNTATFEIADEPHLHFEILKDNENVDPSIYLK